MERNVMKRKLCQLSIYIIMLTASIACTQSSSTTVKLVESSQEKQAIVMESSDTVLQNRFEWAVNQAMAYVHNGEDPVGLWYEAALPKREAFCMRDVAHQSAGANILGLQAHTKNMLYKFAQHISESKDWCSYWEINRYDQPAPEDYRSDDEFWYNLPANFDVLHACLQQYQWTGDEDYIEDSVFLNFYDKTMNEYISHWQLGIDAIMTRDRFMHTQVPLDSTVSFQTCRGLPSYRESKPLNFYLGSDLIAFIYQGYRDYAEILRLIGQNDKAEEFELKAEDTKSFFNDVWWKEEKHSYYSSLHLDGSRGIAPDRYNLTSGISRYDSRDFIILDQLKNNTSTNVESLSYYPQMFYDYDAFEAAYSVIMDLSRSDKKRREYPEVSYGVVEAIVKGLMGIEVEGTLISTRFKGGKNTDWVSFQNIPVQNNLISIRHDGKSESTFTNQSGKTLTWRACFEGIHENIEIDGQVISTQQSTSVSGKKYSWVEVEVTEGEEKVAIVKNSKT